MSPGDINYLRIQDIRLGDIVFLSNAVRRRWFLITHLDVHYTLTDAKLIVGQGLSLEANKLMYVFTDEPNTTLFNKGMRLYRDGELCR